MKPMIKAFGKPFFWFQGIAVSDGFSTAKYSGITVLIHESDLHSDWFVNIISVKILIILVYPNFSETFFCTPFAPLWGNTLLH
jgi:hypothetical protein